MGAILSVSLVGGALAFDNRSFLRLLVSQPICGGLVTGLVLGDWRAGLLAGSVLQMMFLGAIPLRGMPLPDLPLGGVIASSLYILTPRAANLETQARGFALLLSLAAAVVAAVASRAVHQWWENRCDAFAEAARRSVERGRFWAPSAIHFSTLAMHFAAGFVAAGAATAAGVPLLSAIVRAAKGQWCEPLQSLGVLLPFIGAGSLLLFNLTKVRIFMFLAGFGCVVLVLFFKG